MTKSTRLLALSVTTVFGSAATSAIADLTHNWKLNETSGSTAVDSVGGANGAVGGTSAWASGQISNGFKVTGSNVGFVNSGNVPVNGGFTLSFWVNPDDATLDWRNFVSKHEAGAGNKSFWVGQNQADGTLRFGMYFDGSTETALDTSTAVISTGNWAHVTVSWNEATKAQSIFVNGELKNSATRGGQTFVNARNANLLFASNSTSLSAGPGTGSWARFPGTLDDVATWNQPLSNAKIKALSSIASAVALSHYDAQNVDALFSAYDTNFPTLIGNRRWTRTTGLSSVEGAVDQRVNGHAIRFDGAGAGVSALSTISLSFDPIHANIADTSNSTQNPGFAGPDAPAIHLSNGVNGFYASEIDGLTLNSSIGSADIRPEEYLDGDVFVMLWTNDQSGTDDRETLRSELAASANGAFEVLNASNADWVTLAAEYSGFDTLIQFEDAHLVGAFNWDFASHTDIEVDQIAVTSAQVSVPEPGSLGVLVGLGALAARRRR